MIKTAFFLTWNSYNFFSWVLCRVGSTGRPIKLFLNNVPRGCKRLPNENGELNKYEVSNSDNNELINNVMKDQPITSSAEGTTRAKLLSNLSGWPLFSRFSTVIVGLILTTGLLWKISPACFQNSVLVENRLNICFIGIDGKKVMWTDVDRSEA